MNTTEESVFIVYSLKGTPQGLLDEACKAVSSFQRPSFVPSVVVRPRLFEIPGGATPGGALAADLFREIERCVGAIVFVDDLRPNVAYELGVLHGLGRFVLLVTAGHAPSDVWGSISDLGGCALLVVPPHDLTAGIHKYLRSLYDLLSRSDAVQAPRLPDKSRNMVDALLRRARIAVTPDAADFGPSVVFDTWGGVICELGWDIAPSASFTLAVRALDPASTYSIYFWLNYVDTDGQLKQMCVGLTSNNTRIGMESNERTVPGQGLSEEWRLLTGSFAALLRQGHVMDAVEVRRVQKTRMRAGRPSSVADEKVPAWELGFFEVVGRR